MKKVKKAWIPNQVGDDKLLGSSIKDFEDDSGCAFEDDSGCACAFEDDSGCAFEDVKSVVIPHLMRNPGSISFF